MGPEDSGSLNVVFIGVAGAALPRGTATGAGAVDRSEDERGDLGELMRRVTRVNYRCYRVPRPGLQFHLRMRVLRNAEVSRAMGMMEQGRHGTRRVEAP